MFAQIPDFRKNPEAPPSKVKLPAHADALTVHLQPSWRLWLMQRLVHSLLAASLSFAVLPLIPTQPLWLIFWILCLCGLWVSLRVCYWHWRSPSQVLRISGRGWWLQEGITEREIFLSDDAVVLPWLVVLPCRDKNSRARIYLVLLSDSTSLDEHRRLRVWLRTRR